jgi:ATP-binding cassette subfamily B protein
VIASDHPPSTSNLLRRIWGHLSRRRRLQLAVLLLVMLASGLAELVSLGAVLPFLAVLSNPQQLWQQPLIQALALRVGYTQAQQLVLPATAAFALAAVLAALIRLLNLWLNGRLAAAVGSDLSCEAYRRTLYQPYQVHVQRNSSTLITAITGHIGNTVQALNAVLQIVSAFVVAAGLLIGLLLIDWLVAVSTAGLFSIAYGLVAVTSRRQLQQNSVRIAAAANQRVKALQEGLGAIRDVLLDGSQATYLEIYRRADRPQRQLESKNVSLSTFPR